MSTVADEPNRCCDATWNDNIALVNLANIRRLSVLTAPAQSNFRVFALLLISSPSGRQILEGTNSEPCYIGGSICAERSGLTKMRLIADSILEKVVIVSDCDEPISPGALCREYIISAGSKDIVIVMGNNSGGKISQCTIGDLYPFPSVYRFQNRNDIASFSKLFSSKLKENPARILEEHGASAIYKLALNCVQHDKGSKLHPLQMAAAVLYSDNSTDVAWQLKGAEYGCTLDSVSQLVSMIVRKSQSRTLSRTTLQSEECCSVCAAPINQQGKKVESIGTDSSSDITVETAVTAKMIISVDQWGVIHAPHAQARALLTEHGCSDVTIAVQDDEGTLHFVSAGDLLPPPNGAKLLSHDDFI